MNYYKDEKKRIGFFYKLLMGFILFINGCYFLSSVMHQRFAQPNYGVVGWIEGTDFIPFLSSSVWGGIGIILLYLNYNLFWIKDQGESVFLIKKYEITPLTMKQLYGAKIRIMVNAAAAYLIISLESYYFALLPIKYPVINYGKNILEVIELIAIMAVMMAVFIASDIIAHVRTIRSA